MGDLLGLRFARATWLLWMFMLLALPVAAPSQFTFVTNNDNTITITRYTGSAGTVVIPDATNGYPVTHIGNNAFLEIFAMTNVVIPTSITDIGSSAFYYCSNLKSVVIPDSVTTIGQQAFIYCGLTQLTISSGVKEIQDAVFFDCANLTSVAIPNGVTKIGGEAFCLCSSLTNIVIPDSVVSIEGQAFESCVSLVNITIPRSVTKIEAETFYDCSSLKTINVDTLNPAYASLDGVLFNIDFTLLMQCPGGKSGSYIIPDGVTSIGDYAFGVCRSLTNLTIPNSVTNIGVWAFSQCENVSNITIPKSVIYIGDLAFQNCTRLRGVFFQGDAPAAGSRIFLGDYFANFYYLPETYGWDAFVSSQNLFGILWNPAVQAGDPSFGVKSNCFGFTVTGTTNIPFAVEGCANLESNDWALLRVLNLTNGSVYFSDPQWTNYPGRFYRLRSP